MKLTAPLLLALLLSACAGRFDIVRPTTQPTVAGNSKVINKSRDAVWNSSVPELGKQFFVINNLDKSSGLINISYTGDPENYIDCGRIISFVKNARGERTYDFPGAKSHQEYEVMDSQGLYFVKRRLSLEGRVNLIFEEVTPEQTKVTANTRYVLQRQSTVIAAANNAQRSETDTISFNSNSSSSFPPNRKGQALECVPTGALEREILSSVR